MPALRVQIPQVLDDGVNDPDVNNWVSKKGGESGDITCGELILPVQDKPKPKPKPKPKKKAVREQVC